MQLPANSTRILEELGILKEVEKCSVEPIELFIRSYEGTHLYKQSLHPDIRERYGHPHLLIHRADLRRILYDKAKGQGATVLLGACVKNIDFAAMTVELVSGDHHTADLIVGADGEHSTCRELLLRHRNPPRSSGDVVFRLAIPASRLTLQRSTAYFVDHPLSVYAWYGPDSHAVCYPLKKDGIFNVVLTLPESKGEATTGPQPCNLDSIRENCRDWDPDFQDLLRFADVALKWTLLQTQELETWVGQSGAIVLLGDSAHASLPYL